jgi:glycosyltransferase involved in cell wall biosynthesis
MTLSVIIPAYGRQDLLVRCLISLKRIINGDPPCEICVVDDGSGLDADTVRMQVAAGEAFIWKAFETPRGRAAARNKGIHSTTGEIIVFLDSDMEVRDGFLRAHRDAHRRMPHTAVIGAIEWPAGGGFNRYIGSRGVAKLAADETVPPWYFVTGNASVERRDLPSGKPFPEDLPGWGGEDLELGLRLQEAGVNFAHVPEASAFHNFTGDITGHVERTYKYGASSLPILVKRYPALKSILRLDLLGSPLWRAAVHPVVRCPVLAAARLLDPLCPPHFLYDYLTFSAYADGFLRATRNQENG